MPTSREILESVISNTESLLENNADKLDMLITACLPKHKRRKMPYNLDALPHLLEELINYRDLSDEEMKEEEAKFRVLGFMTTLMHILINEARLRSHLIIAEKAPEEHLESVRS